jgi:hypothetical protein
VWLVETDCLRYMYNGLLVLELGVTGPWFLVLKVAIRQVVVRVSLS